MSTLGKQLWTVLDGELAVTVGIEATELAAGDTLVLPARVERQICANEAMRALVCGYGDAVARAPGEGWTRGTPPWIA